MQLTIKTFLLRGLAAGAAGGAATALFIRFFTETQIGWAIGFEEASGLGLPAGEAAEFARSTQHWGGMLAAVIYGMLLGVILAVVLAAFHDRVSGRDEFGRAAKVAGAAFFSTALLPGLKYPPNPPTVGDPDTIGERTWAYLALILVSALIVMASVWLWNRLTERGFTGGSRFLLGGGAFLLLCTVAFVAFPSNPDRIEPPNNEATPALEVAADAPPEVLDAMLANARATGDESYRDPTDTEEPLDLSELDSGEDLVGTPVAVSTAKLEPHAYATMVWTFRIRSFAGLALMWAVIAGVLGLLLDRVVQRGNAT
ncbi:CbtA family protein [Aquihabitans daechungensis]|uniref:CbtA family protein n=1 Tax=Aquihabitans daechungensis TaxID=1052257 RepID=UPI003B9E4E36